MEYLPKEGHNQIWCIRKYLQKDAYNKSDVFRNTYQRKANNQLRFISPKGRPLLHSFLHAELLIGVVTHVVCAVELFQIQIFHNVSHISHASIGCCRSGDAVKFHGGAVVFRPTLTERVTRNVFMSFVPFLSSCLSPMTNVAIRIGESARAAVVVIHCLVYFVQYPIFFTTVGAAGVEISNVVLAGGGRVMERFIGCGVVEAAARVVLAIQAAGFGVERVYQPGGPREWGRLVEGQDDDVVYNVWDSVHLKQDGFVPLILSCQGVCGRREFPALARYITRKILITLRSTVVNL